MLDMSKYKPASYNGVSVLIPSNNQQGGVSTVINRYPGSSKTTVEFLGKYKSSFNLEFVIYGENYWEDRKSILQELDKEEVATFVSPFEGKLSVAQTQPYNIKEDNKKAGKMVITVSLQVVSQSSPFKAIDNLQNRVAQQKVIEDKANSALDAFKTDIEEMETTFAANVDKAINGVRQITSTIRKATSAIVAPIEKINELNSALNSIENEINTLIKTPDVLATSLNSLYKTLTFFSDDPEQQRTANSSLNSYNTGINTTPVTYQQIENYNNQKALEMQSKGSSLTLNLQTSIYINYNTKSQLDEIRAANEELLDSLRDQMSDEAVDAIEDLRLSVNDYLDNLDIQETVKVNVKNESLTSFLMRWYGHIDYYDDIIKLNGLVDTNNINQELEIYE